MGQKLQLKIFLLHENFTCKDICLNVCKLSFFLLHWVFVAVRGLSLLVAGGGCSLGVVPRLLTAVASLVEHGLGSGGAWA